jgi:hypothetical protein
MSFLTGALPWLVAAGGIISVIWSFSSQISANESAVQYQGAEITTLIKGESDQQILSYTISTQLAQLSQSVADIKSVMAK